ncbi:MAG: Sec-independent protein translocase protein TatB [Pseudomonadota bacterium]
MFDIGFWELMLIGVVTLLVVGPERLPAVAQKAGRLIGKLRAKALGVREELEREFNTSELRDTLHRQEQELHNLRIMMNETQDKAEAAARLEANTRGEANEADEDDHGR